VSGHALRYRPRRLNHQTFSKFGLRAIQKHFHSADRHRIDFRSFEHDDIRLIDVIRGPGRLTRHIEPNVQPVSANRHDPVAAGGFCTPKRIHPPCKKHRRAEPSCRSYRNNEAQDDGDQQDYQVERAAVNKCRPYRLARTFAESMQRATSGVSDRTSFIWIDTNSIRRFGISVRGSRASRETPRETRGILSGARLSRSGRTTANPEVARKWGYFRIDNPTGTLIWRSARRHELLYSHP
jgi:hypothetical protein